MSRLYLSQQSSTAQPLSRAEENPARAKDAIALRKEDPKKYTEEVLGRMFGVARNTISTWMPKDREDIPIVNPDNRNTSAPNLDARVKAPRRINTYTEEVLGRMFGVAQQTVSDWIPRDSNGKSMPITGTGNRHTAPIPDARVLAWLDDLLRPS
jgi:hypothetical protein